jgi:hypothetical protein
MSARFIVANNPGNTMRFAGRAAGGIVANESVEVINQIAHDQPSVSGMFTTFIPIWNNFKPDGTVETWLHDCTQ